MDFSLEGRVAIVTGGGTGVGRGIAIGLAEAGADVVVAARRMEPLSETCQAIEGLGRRALAVQTDVTLASDTKALAARTLEAFGRIDVLVNNAGGSFGATFKRGPLLELTPEDIDGCLALNVRSVLLCGQAVVPAMMAQERGAIINIASIGGRGISAPSPGFGMYGPSKAAVVTLTYNMATEWAPHVRVNAVAPSTITTPRVEATRTPEVEVSITSTIALGRIGKPEDVAGAVVFLASDAASWVTGSVIDVHGGLRSARLAPPRG